MSTYDYTITPDGEIVTDPATEWDTTLPDTLDASWVDAALEKRKSMMGFLARRDARRQKMHDKARAEYEAKVKAIENWYYQETSACEDALIRLLAAITERGRAYRALTGKASVTSPFGKLVIKKPDIHITWPTRAADKAATVAALKLTGRTDLIRVTEVPAHTEEAHDAAAIRALIESKDSSVGIAPDGTLVLGAEGTLIPNVVVTADPGDVNVVDADLPELI